MRQCEVYLHGFHPPFDERCSTSELAPEKEKTKNIYHVLIEKA